MPSERYLLVEGVDGHPVSDPHNPSANPARYVGWKLKDIPEGKPSAVEDPDHILEHYDPERQVVKDRPDLRSAIGRKHLTKHAETIAKNHDAARAALIKDS